MPPFVGKTLSSRRFSVDEAGLGDYYRGLRLTPEPGAPVPTMYAGEPDNAYFGEIAFDNHFGHLWMRQEWSLHQPLEVGATYSVGGRITEIYQRRDRSVVNYAVELTDDDGNIRLKSQHHQSFLLEQQSGELKLRDPKAKEGARKFDVPDGDAFGDLERRITVQMCGDFFHGDANYHTNQAASRELGFRDVVVGGRMTMAYVGHVLEQRYGAAWWTSGQMLLRFTNPVWPDDTIIVRGVETGPLTDEAGRTGAFVWIHKPDDSIVLIVQASVAG